jgi:hypothetical protein
MVCAQVLGELIVGFHCYFHTRSYQQCKVSNLSNKTSYVRFFKRHAAAEASKVVSSRG